MNVSLKIMIIIPGLFLTRNGMDTYYRLIKMGISSTPPFLASAAGTLAFPLLFVGSFPGPATIIAVESAQAFVSILALATKFDFFYVFGCTTTVCILRGPFCRVACGPRPFARAAVSATCACVKTSAVSPIRHLNIQIFRLASAHCFSCLHFQRGI